MLRVYIGIIIGIAAVLAFVYFGGADFLRYIERHTDRAAVKVEKYEKKLHKLKDSAGKVREKAEETGKNIKKYIP